MSLRTVFELALIVIILVQNWRVLETFAVWGAKKVGLISQ
jgi:hypothetical protein